MYEFQLMNIALKNELEENRKKFERCINDYILPGDLKKRMKNLSHSLKTGKVGNIGVYENRFLKICYLILYTPSLSVSLSLFLSLSLSLSLSIYIWGSFNRWGEFLKKPKGFFFQNVFP